MNMKLLVSVTATLLIAGNPMQGATDHKQGSTQHNQQVAGALPAAVREATRRYQNVEAAELDGYVRVFGCVSGPNEGAMGVHYLRGDLIDDIVAIEQPEALVYEPMTNGRLRLVAAEYITPAPLWHTTHGPDDTPQLAGHLLNYVPGPNRYGAGPFYEIHVWAWRENGHGTFADWNPNVSCAAWKEPSQ